MKLKVNKKILLNTLAYRKLINTTPFDDIDWSEFEGSEAISSVQKEEFKFTGLNNIDYYRCFLKRRKSHE